MKTKLVLLLGVMTVLPVLGACPGLPGSGTTHFTSAQYDGWTATIQAGDRLIVLLRTNPSTGYEWQVGTNNTSVLEYYQTYLASDDTSVTGSGGTLAMEFKAIGAGTSQLVLNYVRPSDPPGTAPSDTFTDTVYVTP
jgi:inhibitor of cysteine peptidase